MENSRRKELLEWQNLVDRLQEADIPDLDKVLQAFDYITAQHVENGMHEIELARAMKDQETVIREQIKIETMKFANKSLQEIAMIFTRRTP